MKSDRAWLDALKPGDEVAVGVDYGRRWMVGRVVRRTNTLILCDLGGGVPTRYRASDGYKIPRDTWNPRRIEPFTNEIRAAVQRDNCLARIRYAKWEELPTETLRTICDLIAKKEMPA